MSKQKREPAIIRKDLDVNGPWAAPRAPILKTLETARSNSKYSCLSTARNHDPLDYEQHSPTRSPPTSAKQSYLLRSGPK
ncbi:MAG: hypothetical protein WBE73_18400, partial [Candidatus Acidiferrum sp.]